MPLRLPKSRTARALLMLGLTAVFAVGMTGVFAVLFPTQALGSSSTLEVLDGVVAISRDGTTFVMGKDGDLIEEGNVVRTGENSHGVLTFFDGSVIELEPDSEMRIETLQATTAGDILMTMQQTVGRSWHVVSRTLTANSKYEIRTPAATAAVRGTAFTVSVAPDGTANIQTTDGVVGTAAGGQEVRVPPGFQTNVPPGGVPEPASPAPPPPALVRVVLDPTPNAAVVDPQKRTVGLLNGIPVRYVPGSTVELVDGKLVLTIPNPALGRFDTHVQPADPTKSTVDVNVQVVIGGVPVGNVVEQRGVGANGLAKGGIVLTPRGTVVLPDSDVATSEDPQIGKLPPPPSGGLSLFGPATPGPTMVVTPPPSFVSRVTFDQRLTLAPATPTPTPTPGTTLTAFNGAYQTFTKAEGTATPAPNSNLLTFTSSTDTLQLVASPTPTPSPTLGTKLTTVYQFTPAPALTLATATPTPTPAVLRTLDTTVCCVLLATPTPTPTLLLRTLDPICCVALPTASPTPTPTPSLLLRTLDPICCIVLPTASPTPTPSLILRTIDPICCIVLPTASPTPSPTPSLIFRTIDPGCCIVLPTASPTPTVNPTLICCFTIAPRTLAPTPIPTPTQTPIVAPTLICCFSTITPKTATPAPTATPTPAIVPTFALPTLIIAPTPTPTPTPLRTIIRCLPGLTC